MSNIGEGATPLMYACQQSREKEVLDILAKKPKAARERDRTLKTPLHYCAENSNISCAEAILRVASDVLDAKDEDGYTVLHLAVIAGNKLLLRLLVSRGANVNALDNENHSAVHWATVCGEQEALEMILRAGANPSTADMHGGYPLHYAAQMCGPGSEMSGDPRIGLSVLRKLLSYGVEINVEDKDGRQPILWAASAGSADAILTLVNAGASVDAADKDGLTALHCAASRGHTDCLETLVALCGANVDVIDSNGCTALFYATTLGHADSTQLLLSLGAEPNRQDRKGRTPAHCGAAKGQLETLRILLSHGANLWLRNVKGDFPLHEAVASGRKELVQWLLNQRSDVVNVANNDGRCPIHVAAINNNVEMIKILLDAQSLVNPIMRTSKNVMMTPLDAALFRGNRGCAKYLQLHGGVPFAKLGEQTTNVRGNGSRQVATELQLVKTDEFSQARLAETASGPAIHETLKVNGSGAAMSTEVSPSRQHSQRQYDEESSNEDKTYRRRRRRRRSDRKKSFPSEEDSESEEESQDSRTRPRRKKKDSEEEKKSRHKKDGSGESSGEGKPGKRRASRKRGSSSEYVEEDEEQSPKRRGKKYSDSVESEDENRKEKKKKPKKESEDEKTKEAETEEVKEEVEAPGEKVDSPEKEDTRPGVEEVEAMVHQEEETARVEEEDSEKKEETPEEGKKSDESEEKQMEEDESLTIEMKQADGELGDDDIEILMEDNNIFVKTGKTPEETFIGIEEDISDRITFQTDIGLVDNEEEHTVRKEMDSLKDEDSSLRVVKDHTGKTTRRLSSSRKSANVLVKTESEERDEMVSRMADVETVIKGVRLGDGDGRSTSMGDDSGASTRNEDSSVLLDSGIEPSPRRGRKMQYEKRERETETASSKRSRVPRLCRKGKSEEELAVTTISVTQAVQNTIRKYHLERRIFYQLLELKRQQIRAGKANEQVLVKRLIDEYKRAGLIGGLKSYNGSYTFRQFESFLYDQLHTLQATGQMLIPQLKPTDDIETLSNILKKTRVQLLDDIPSNPIFCTHGTHRCHHAAHAYTGIPCAAYITKINHHEMPKSRTSGFLPRIDPSPTSRPDSKKMTLRPVTLELTHGSEKQVISLPTDRLDRNKRYYVTFTIKGGPTPDDSRPGSTGEEILRHRHAKSF